MAISVIHLFLSLRILRSVVRVRLVLCTIDIGRLIYLPYGLNIELEDRIIVDFVRRELIVVGRFRLGGAGAPIASSILCLLV